jgi:hypothetical protein
MQQHRLPAEVAPARADAWYRQPVLWLGAAVFAASLAGCIATIVVSSRHVDAPVRDAHPRTLLEMPVRGAGNMERGTGNMEGAGALLPHGTTGVAANPKDVSSPASGRAPGNVP